MPVRVCTLRFGNCSSFVFDVKSVTIKTIILEGNQMNRKFTKILAVFAFVATIGLTNVSPLVVSAAADTCTWTGATNGNWSTGTNWTGCDNSGVPENGDTLVFPASAANK